MNRYTLGLLLLFCINLLNGQTSFSFGPELTLATNQLWHWDTQKKSTGEYSEKDSPLLGFGIGMNGQLVFQNGIMLSSSIGYQLTGNRFYSTKTESIPRDPNASILYSYRNEEIKKQTFHKIRIPFNFGYRFNNNKYKPSIFLGASLNWLFAGKYSRKNIHKRSDRTESFMSEIEYNPLDIKGVFSSLDPLLFQGIVGGSFQLWDSFKISASLSYGGKHRFNQFDDLICILVPPEIFSNNEIGISVVWFMNTKTKNKD